MKVSHRQWNFEIKRIPFRRQITLVVKGFEQLRVIGPLSLSLDAAVAFIEERKEWVLESQKKFLKYQQKTKKSVNVGGKFLFRGQPYEIKISPTPNSKIFFRDNHPYLEAHLPLAEFHHFKTKQELKEEALFATLKNFYRKSGDRYLRERTLILSQQHGCDLRRIQIRGQSSRWGSCSSKKNISLNWKLIAFSPEIIDYVICHELAHLTHMNHSRAFWNEVERMYGPYQSAKQQIRELAHEVEWLK